MTQLIHKEKVSNSLEHGQFCFVNAVFVIRSALNSDDASVVGHDP